MLGPRWNNGYTRQLPVILRILIILDMSIWYMLAKYRRLDWKIVISERLTWPRVPGVNLKETKMTTDCTRRNGGDLRSYILDSRFFIDARDVLSCCCGRVRDLVVNRMERGWVDYSMCQLIVKVNGILKFGALLWCGSLSEPSPSCHICTFRRRWL